MASSATFLFVLLAAAAYDCSARELAEASATASDGRYEVRSHRTNLRHLSAAPPTPGSNPLVFCGTNREYECSPGTTCCCLRRSSPTSNGSPRCDWYCCEGTCCSDRQHYCPAHLLRCNTARGQCLAATGTPAAPEPFRSLAAGPSNGCQAAHSRLHVLDPFGVANGRPGGSNVVKDSLNGFATHYITGGKILHDSLTTAEDYGKAYKATASSSGSGRSNKVACSGKPAAQPSPSSTKP